MINLFPWIANLPMIAGESVSKRIVGRLAGVLLQDSHVISNAHRTDILSLLVKDNQKKGKSEVGLTDMELLDNVCKELIIHDGAILLTWFSFIGYHFDDGRT